MTPEKARAVKEAAVVKQAGAKVLQLFKDAAEVRQGEENIDLSPERYAELDRIVGTAIREIVTLISCTVLAGKKFPES